MGLIILSSCKPQKARWGGGGGGWEWGEEQGHGTHSDDHKVTVTILTSVYRKAQLIKLEEIAIESPDKLSDKILR